MSADPKKKQESEPKVKSLEPIFKQKYMELCTQRGELSMRLKAVELKQEQLHKERDQLQESYDIVEVQLKGLDYTCQSIEKLYKDALAK